MKMLSKIAKATKALKQYICLEHRITTYRERRQYYRQRAISESLKSGVLDTKKGVELIDVINTTALTVCNDNQDVQIEFAQDRNGIYFARIEGTKYYPIDIEPSEALLKKSRHYEKLSKSLLRRYLSEPYELVRFKHIIYSLDKIYFGLTDIVFQLKLLVVNLEQSEDCTEETNRNLCDKLTDKSLGDNHNII